MKREHAEALVSAWKADGAFDRLSYMKELADAYGFFPGVVSVRVLIGQRNKLASNALWEGHFETGLRLLMRHGLLDKHNARYGAREINNPNIRRHGIGANRTWWRRYKGSGHA